MDVDDIKETPRRNDFHFRKTFFRLNELKGNASE